MHLHVWSIVIVLGTGLLTSCKEVVQQVQHSYPPAPPSIEMESGAERIDLYWGEPRDWNNQRSWYFEVFARELSKTEFAKAHEGYLSTPAYSDMSRKPGIPVEYKVRTVIINASNQIAKASTWSDTVTAQASPYDTARLLRDIQKASFRFFWNYAHPVSGLPREGAGSWEPNMCSIAGSGMMFFNIAVGIENEWITYKEGIEHINKALTFLTEKADRFHGVFPHWVNGQTGKTIPFGEKDNGADLVETAFLVSGALFFREYVKDDTSETAQSIREKANAIWKAVEWDWFVKEKSDGRKPLLWHWSPDYGFEIDLEIVGFNECHMTYILALASPTHPITPDSYFKGWLEAGYGRERLHYDINLELSREEYGPPLFYTHYSYLGVHPNLFTYGSQNYFEHFEDFCRVQVLWAEENRPELAGTGIWGLTAGLDPDGYSARFPGNDNGTISPTAFLASYPYAPEAAQRALESTYKLYGKKLWGPFGFYDAMNPSRDWYGDGKYIAIDVGPVAPMIENHQSGFCWNILTQAPEIQRALEIINAGNEP